MKSTEFVKQRFDILESLVNDKKFDDDYVHKLCENIILDTLTYEPYFEEFKIFFSNTFDNIVKLGIVYNLKFENITNILSQYDDYEDIKKTLQEADSLDNKEYKAAELAASQDFPKLFMSDSLGIFELLLDLASLLSRSRRVRGIMRKVIEHASSDEIKQENIKEKLDAAYKVDGKMVALAIIKLLDITVSFNIPIYQFYNIKEDMYHDN